MGIFLTKRELAQTEPAEKLDFKSPVPTRIVSNGEFNPLPQTQRQRQFEVSGSTAAAAGVGDILGLHRRQRRAHFGCAMGDLMRLAFQRDADRASRQS